jgi:hypothetical protein
VPVKPHLSRHPDTLLSSQFSGRNLVVVAQRMAFGPFFLWTVHKPSRTFG